ncbi:hypothetical protein ARMGADRAFT_1004076 [Armillaria gallica]|uniref:Uncharacterized protein n=1 Tax=Armillaria gallica TaxID=47427 RepID=A0A2H3E7C3_ARMGA|nr:hypothetical protein ARMGADRAFT_1004076 [Armillaria gallica]
MYRTPPHEIPLSVALDASWQFHPPYPLPTDTSHRPYQYPHESWQNVGPPDSCPPYSLPGRQGPFLHTSHHTPAWSFLSQSTFPVDTHHQPQHPPAPPYPPQQHPPPGFFPFVPPHIVNNQTHPQFQQQSMNIINDSDSTINNSVAVQNTHHYDTYSSPFLSTSFSVPSTTSIPELTGKSTWMHWLRGVKSVADLHGVFPHIVEDPPNFVSPNPMRRASYPPLVDQRSTPQDWETYVVWQRRDTVMMHILSSKLSSDVSSVIPMIDDPECTTAREMLACLRRYFDPHPGECSLYGSCAKCLQINTSLRSMK